MSGPAPRRPLRLRAIIAACAAGAGLLFLHPPPAVAIELLAHFPATQLSIRTHDATEWFSTWVADSPERQQQGLQFLEWMAADQGMLFPQATPRLMSMWMKDTLIPLDMLFIDDKGRIVAIRERTTPRSLELIRSPVQVAAVRELAGGECSALGIRVGDQVRHRIFGTDPGAPVRN